MEDILNKFFKSDCCNVEEFAQKLDSLSGSVQVYYIQNEFKLIIHNKMINIVFNFHQSCHVLFNQAVLNVHAGRLREACEILKDLLSSGLFSC